MRLLLVTAALGAWSFAVLAQAPVAAGAQPQSSSPEPASYLAAPLEPGEGRAVASKLGQELVKAFVYRDQAEAYAAMLSRNAAAGRYDKATRGELAKLMTDDLMAVHKDGHLHVMVTDPAERNAQHGGSDGPPKDFPPLIQSARTFAPGIGYIRFSAFFGTSEEMAGVRKWLAANENDNVLIFDLRNHHGGGLEEQDAIFSYVFARKTPLVRMALSRSVFDEHGSPIPSTETLQFQPEGDQMVATHVALPGKSTALRHARIFLLVSNRTASAAEHFSLAMKSTGRGTLIGEPTAGANHFGGPAELNEHFAVWMPVGRTYDVKTGKDWEGSGIAPDIQADPKQALVLALEKAGLAHDEAVRLDAQEVPSEPVHSDKLRAR